MSESVSLCVCHSLCLSLSVSVSLSLSLCLSVPVCLSVSFVSVYVAMELAVQDVAHMTDSKPTTLYNMHNKSGTEKHSTNSSHPATVECYCCGGNDYATKCHFMDATCRTCGKKGHLAQVCCSSAKGSFQTSKKPQTGKSSPPWSTTCPNPYSKSQFPTHSLHEEPHPLAPTSPVSDYPLFTFPSNAKPIVVTVQVNNVDLPMELDTGGFSIINQ